ncbi:MAG: RnfABCDGE type electron transport complex subunit B [Anaerovoracaceae bacterium]|nr:RnfABCDGE type electron transport complex subunit B [Anaerovoracaceae bacterium]
MGTIVLPAIIVAVVGLIFGIILTVASKLMYVPVDEKISAIRDILPGANCGGCGFAGCDDYANAFGDDPNLSPTLCPVGGPDLATKIAEILGVEAGEVEEKVAMVMCQGNYGVTKQIMEADRIYTCATAKAFYGGNWACPHGCLGMGDCLRSCKYDAIRIVNGVAVVDREKCIACGACSKVCPNSLIKMVPKKMLVHVACSSVDKGAVTRKICENGCIGCKKCQKSCKFDAIIVEDNLARVDLTKCKNCGVCAKECPTGAIVNFRKKKAAPAVKPAAETAAAAAE